MSDPRVWKDNPLDGIAYEMISAMSALNMYACPIEGAEGYLSETDFYAKHSYGHLDALTENYHLHKREYQELLRAVDSLLHFTGYDGVDLFGYSPQERLDFLKEMTNKQREAIRGA